MRKWLWMAGMAVAVGASGCAVSSTTVTVERTIEQNALVPAPSGPRATGPMPLEGRPALEIGYSGTPVLQDGQAHWEGERGDVVIEHMLRARLSIAPTRFFEIGLNLEYAHAGFAQSVAADTSMEELGEHFVRVGPSVRFLGRVDERWFVGGVAEFDVAAIPYVSDVYEKAWQTDWRITYGPWWFDYDQRTTLLGPRESRRSATSVRGMFRGGFQAGIDVLPEFTVTFGLLGQNIPVFRGAKLERFTCTGVGMTASECAASNPPEIPDVTDYFVGSLYMSLAYRIDRATLLFQLTGHPIGPDSIREATPLSIDLGVRFQM